MNCPQIQTELSAYVDGELPPSIRAEVEAHIEGCAACRKRLAELRKLAEGVAALPKLQPAPQFLAAVRRKIARGETPEQRNWIDLLFRPVWVKVPIEAVALAADSGGGSRADHTSETKHCPADVGHEPQRVHSR